MLKSFNEMRGPQTETKVQSPSSNTNGHED